MLWKWSCGRRISDLINPSFPKPSNSRVVTGKEPNHTSRSQSSGNTRKLVKPRKSTSPKALEMAKQLWVQPPPNFNSISSQNFGSLDLFPPLQTRRKPQELHRSCDGSNPCLHLGFWCQQRENLWLWKADSQIFTHGCYGNIHPRHSWLIFQLPTIKRRWWSKHRLFPEADGAGNSCPPQPTVATRILAEVLLVIFLGVIKLRSLPDLCGDGAKASLCQHLKEKPGKAISGLLWMTSGFLPEGVSQCWDHTPSSSLKAFHACSLSGVLLWVRHPLWVAHLFNLPQPVFYSLC